MMADEKRIQAACDEGQKIYNDWYERNNNDESFKALDYQARYDYYFNQYTDFARQYPIILRYAVCFGMFHQKAVKMYLKKCMTVGVKTDEEYCERQADYVKYVWMYSNNHLSTKKLNAIWQQTKDALMEELSTRKKETEAIKNMREKNKNDNYIKRIENVRQRITRLANERVDA